MMNDALYHEQLYRTEDVMRRMKELPITVCGGGALGANLTENLARQGFGRLRVIDRDRVEERNLSTQPFYRTDVGAHKAKILSNALYRALAVKVEPYAEELTPANAGKLLAESGLVVDTFDNSVSRQAVKDACEKANLPCLHIGLAGDYAEIIWNSVYRVPSDANDDICDYPLARNLVGLAVAIAGETIVNFVAKSEQNSYTVTLGDFAVRPFVL